MPVDRFPSLAALKKELGASAYNIRCLDRGANLTIVSAHGGYIEPGTSAIAREIAGRQWNLFDFQGLRADLASDMHVTATRFRDPELSRLLRKSRTCVSVHGMGNQGHTTIWLGGLNLELKALVLSELKNFGFEVEPDSPRYRGESPKNFVNLACRQGVQLELSYELLDELFCRKAFLPSGRRPPVTKRFWSLVGACRQAVNVYMQTPAACGPCSGSLDEPAA